MVAKACEKACLAIITLVDTCTRWDHNVGTTDLTHIYINCTTLWASFNVQLQIFLNVILKGNRCGPSLHFEIYNENNFSLDYDCFLKTNFISM